MDSLTHLPQGTSAKAPASNPALSGSAADDVDVMLLAPYGSFADALQTAVGQAASSDPTEAKIIDQGLEVFDAGHAGSRAEPGTRQLPAGMPAALPVPMLMQHTLSMAQGKPVDAAPSRAREGDSRAHDSMLRAFLEFASAQQDVLPPQVDDSAIVFTESGSSPALQSDLLSAGVEPHGIDGMPLPEAGTPSLAPSPAGVLALPLSQAPMPSITAASSAPSSHALGSESTHGLAIDSAGPMRITGGSWSLAEGLSAASPAMRAASASAAATAMTHGTSLDLRELASAPVRLEDASGQSSPVAIAPTAQQRMEDATTTTHGVDVRLPAWQANPALARSLDDAAAQGLAGPRIETLELADATPTEVLPTDHGLPNAAVRASGRGAEFLATVAEFQVAEPVLGEHFAAALGTRLTTMVRDGVHEARLQLNPSELGPVLVRISMEGDAARIDFHAQLPSTRQSLESSIPTLASALRDAGLTLSGGGVFQQPGDQASSARNFQGQGEQASRHANTDVALTDASALRVTSITRERRGLVDLVA